MSRFLSPRRLRALFLRNPRARYALVGAVAVLVAWLLEMKRREDNRDEIKRRTPHRRNSAVHLYDGDLGRLSVTDSQGPMKSLCHTRIPNQELS